MMKSSILREWGRIFVSRRQRNLFWWICHILIGITVMFNCSIIIATSVSCSPRDKIWDKTTRGHCVDPRITLIISAVINVVLDLFILLLPQRTIWSLHMTKGKKIGVSLVFTIGVLYVPFNNVFHTITFMPKREIANRDYQEHSCVPVAESLLHTLILPRRIRFITYQLYHYGRFRR